MSAEEKIQFTVQEGKDYGHGFTVYALSTCGFCKRALSFLNEKNAAYRYVYIDLLPLEVKSELKNELREKFNKSMLFPFLVVDGKDAFAGFEQEKWEEFFR